MTLPPATAALAALLLLPAAASAARRAQPLVDAAPAATSFPDRVIRSPAPDALARTSQASASYRAYPTPDGQSVAVAMSPAYAADDTVARSYVGFLAGLPHGGELSSLRVFIAPAVEVQTLCGGVEGVLACYDARQHLMVVPGEQTAASAGVTTSYVVTHEYGHHVAAYRSNAPFSALDYGPKQWASYELVCDRTLAGLLAPGDEGAGYGANPGEGWAETYARLKYPGQPWMLAPLLAPDAGALAAAQRDVQTPWTQPVTRTFSGRFGRRSANARRFTFALRLDGRLIAVLRRPRGSRVRLTLIDGGRIVGRTPSAGVASLRYAAACRAKQVEQVTVSVLRIAGGGPFGVQVSYAG